MNVLYGILMGGQSVPQDYAWYYKNYTLGIYSDKINALRDSLMADADTDGATAMVASCLCYLVLYTEFGAEIKKLDENNTYTPISRPTDAASSDPKYNMYSYIKPSDAYSTALGYVDQDIRDRVDSKSFISIAAAICLQMLRELNR